MDTKLCLLATILFAAVASQPQPQYEVVHISEYIRHGARTAFLNKLNYSFTQEIGAGNLTANGMRTTYLLGKQLRQMYPKLFNDSVEWDDVLIYSSSIGRTIVSASTHLMGLFPLGIGDNITDIRKNSTHVLPPFAGVDTTFDGEKLFALPHGFKPFPYVVTSPQIDLMFLPAMHLSCPDGNSMANRKTLDLHNKYSYLMSNLSQELTEAGWDPQKFFQIENYTIERTALLYDEMKSYLNYYGTFPSGMNAILFEKLKKVANLNFNLVYSDEKITRLFSNGVARQLIEGMKSVIYGTSSAKFFLYSGHDLGIYSHLLLYKMTSLECK